MTSCEPFGTVSVAILALMISSVSLFFSWKQHVLSRTQEQRRKPALILEYLDGYFSTNPSTRDRTYHFSLTFRNPTDSDNAIARVELRIEYRLPDGTTVAVRLPAASEYRANGLSVPQRVAAHDTISGWSQFVLDAKLIDGRHIELYVIELRDSQDQLVKLTPHLLSERSDG